MPVNRGANFRSTVMALVSCGARLVLTVAGLVFLVAGPVAAPAVNAAEIRVAVAANFATTLQSLADRYAKLTGDRLLVSPGSSGQLFAQINEGAPFDVFLSADAERPDRLVSAGKARAATRCVYAVGRLALWSPVDGRIDKEGRFLERGGYSHLAIADPALAPYGMAARSVLEARHLWDGLNADRKLVTGTSVAQAQQFASSEAAEAAFISEAQILELPDGKRGSWWLPPASDHAPILQVGVVIGAAAADSPAAHLLHWLCSDPAARGAIEAAGYDSPQAADPVR